MKRRSINAPVGASFIVLSSLFYASYGIWTTLIGNFLGGYTAATIRGTVALLIMAPIAFYVGQIERLQLSRTWRPIVGLAVLSAFVWGPLYYAILHAGVGTTSAVNYAALVIGMFIFGKLLAKERFSKDKWLSTILGLSGLWLIFIPHATNGTWLALAAATLSGLSIAASGVIAKKLPYGPMQSSMVMWGVSTMTNIPMAIIMHEPTPLIGWHIQWFYVLIFSLASVAASWSFIYGIKKIEAGAAGILGLLEIVFGVAFGVVFFHERPGLMALLGIVSIVAAASIPYLKDYNRNTGKLKTSG